MKNRNMSLSQCYWFPSSLLHSNVSIPHQRSTLLNIQSTGTYLSSLAAPTISRWLANMRSTSCRRIVSTGTAPAPGFCTAKKNQKNFEYRPVRVNDVDAKGLTLIRLHRRHQAKGAFLAADNLVHLALDVPQSVEHFALAGENLIELALVVRFEPLFGILLARSWSVRIGFQVPDGATEMREDNGTHFRHSIDTRWHTLPSAWPAFPDTLDILYRASRGLVRAL